MTSETIRYLFGLLFLGVVYWLFGRHGWKTWETFLLIVSLFAYGYLTSKFVIP